MFIFRSINGKYEKKFRELDNEAHTLKRPPLQRRSNNVTNRHTHGFSERLRHLLNHRLHVQADWPQCKRRGHKWYVVVRGDQCRYLMAGGCKWGFVFLDGGACW